MTPAEPGPRGGVLGPQCGSSLPAPRATSPGLWFSLSALSSLPVSVTYTSRLQSCPSRLCEPLGWEWLPRCLWLRVPLRSPCGCQLWPQLRGGGGPAPRPGPHHGALHGAACVASRRVGQPLQEPGDRGGSPGAFSDPDSAVLCGHPPAPAGRMSPASCRAQPTFKGVRFHPSKGMSKTVWAYFKPAAVLRGLGASLCPLGSSVGQWDFLPPCQAR